MWSERHSGTFCVLNLIFIREADETSLQLLFFNFVLLLLLGNFYEATEKGRSGWAKAIPVIF